MKIIKMDLSLNEQLSLFEQPISNQYDEQDLYNELYHYIIRTKSIIGLEIEIPSMDIKCSCLDFSNNGRKYKGKGGIYFLFGKKGELLNIGNTNDLYGRISDKWLGKNGGSEADFLFYHYYNNVSLFCEDDELKRRVYEAYLINKLKPPLNKKFNYYDTSIYDKTLEKEKSTPYYSHYKKYY